MSKITRLASLSLLFVLAGCGGMADTLGIGRNPPDEFAVVDRPPLSLPPDYALRPPRPGAPRPQEASMSDKAETTLFGARTKDPAALSGSVPGGESDAEKAVLATAGAAKADPGIRELVDREATQKAVGSRHLVDEIMWWRDASPSATTVDAKAEAERLKEAKEKGETPAAGATPVISKNKSGWLGL